MLGSDFTILLTLLSAIFAPINFISYLLRGKAITSGKLWAAIQILTIVVIPALFLSFMDLPIKNECCKDSAVFSPEHRIGIYLLIILCMAAYVVSIFRKDILPPIAELFLNLFLLLGLVLNIIFCKQFTTFNEGYLWWVFGNLPIIFLLLIMLTENQKRLKLHIDANNYTSNSTIGKLCVSVLKLKPILKYPTLAIISVPIIIFFSFFLMLFGQKPDSIIKAFTDTYKHGFSQLDYMCDNIKCGGHFLCSVGANGHKSIVKPLRYGVRNGNKIICNRQLLISNAFEDLVQEKFPLVHKTIRRNYNVVGDQIHKHYHIFNNRIVSDLIYLLMKPLELFFLLTIYALDKKPENRISMQYLSSSDKQKINSIILS